MRPELFLQVPQWQAPTGDEIVEVVKMISTLRGCRITGADVAKLVGLGESGSRTYRRWISNDSAIPFSVWAILVFEAGMGSIWSDALSERNLIQNRALKAIHECLLCQRYYVGRTLSAEGKQYLYELADVAHNIPLALSGESKITVDQPYFIELLNKLETLLAQPMPNPAFLK